MRQGREANTVPAGHLFSKQTVAESNKEFATLKRKQKREANERKNS
jgi:hypothetical protein